MEVMIRCNYCGRAVPYNGYLYKIQRQSGLRGCYYDDNYRYCTKVCAERQIEKEGQDVQSSKKDD